MHAWTAALFSLYLLSEVHVCVAEGVQLLCLIDKAADACRYLQTYGEWNRAAWLAKVCNSSLPRLIAPTTCSASVLRQAEEGAEVP